MYIAIMLSVRITEKLSDIIASELFKRVICYWRTKQYFI